MNQKKFLKGNFLIFISIFFISNAQQPTSSILTTSLYYPSQTAQTKAYSLPIFRQQTLPSTTQSGQFLSNLWQTKPQNSSAFSNQGSWNLPQVQPIIPSQPPAFTNKSQQSAQLSWVPQTKPHQFPTLWPSLTHHNRHSPSKSHQQPKSSNETGIITTFIQYQDGIVEGELKKQNISQLTTQQKYIDSFIRNTSGVGNQSNLTMVSANNNYFKYQYQAVTDNFTKDWLIDVQLINNTQSILSQQPNYKLIGLTYIQNARLTQQQNQQIDMIQAVISKQKNNKQKQFNSNQDIIVLNYNLLKSDKQGRDGWNFG